MRIFGHTLDCLQRVRIFTFFSVVYRTFSMEWKIWLKTNKNSPRIRRKLLAMGIVRIETKRENIHNVKMNLFAILVPYYLMRFVRCEDKPYETSTFEIQGDPEDYDGVNYDETDVKWVSEAVLSVAYYLRSHKFNGYDARNFTERPPPEKSNFYGKFADPPLKYFHFDVFQNCKENFTSCLRYLYETVLDADLQRSIDTVYVARKNNWTFFDNAKEIRNIDGECNKMKELDEKKGDPFEGPVDRFKWITTARYYMCWFTLSERPELSHFNEPCDNFASCLMDGNATHNDDIRADDSIPFQCAMYSFCPDPCCADKKLLLATDSCQLTDGNPCRSMNNPECSFNKTLNRSFISMVYNEWNVSCVCLLDGYRWNSRYGQCVDYNECRFQNPCDNETQDCVNTPGNFICQCKFKFKWSEEERRCVEDDVMIKAIKRFSGVADGSNFLMPNSIYWIFAVLISMSPIVIFHF